MNWYVAQTNPRQEATANHWLQQAGYTTLFLHYQGTHSHERRETSVILPLFPSYLFLAVDKDIQGFRRAVTSPGVRSIVGRNEPEEVPIEVIEELRERGDETGLCILTPEEKKLRKRLRRGARVVCAYDEFTVLAGQVILDTGSAVSMWINGRKWTAPSHHVSPVLAER